MKKLFIIVVFASIIVSAFLIFLLLFDKDEHIAKVEILNTTESRDVANTFAEILKKNRFEVFCVNMVENEDLDNTSIVDRKDKKMKYAKSVAKIFKCKEVFSIIDTTLNIDVTIIIGKDYEEILKRSSFGKESKNDR
uniref:LytR family transcriptional regulator n=1 Tax=candidate division WOR-3 bacterium TaxID=2052148 RepID=A0A7C3N9M6_UNCW3